MQLFWKQCKWLLVFALIISMVVPAVGTAEESNTGEGNVEASSSAVHVPTIVVASADDQSIAYRSGDEAKEDVQVTIANEAAFEYSIAWTTRSPYGKPTHAKSERVSRASSMSPVSVTLAGNEQGIPVKYTVTAVDKTDSTRTAKFEVIVAKQQPTESEQPIGEEPGSPETQAPDTAGSGTQPAGPGTSGPKRTTQAVTAAPIVYAVPKGDLSKKYDGPTVAFGRAAQVYMQGAAGQTLTYTVTAESSGDLLNSDEITAGADVPKSGYIELVGTQDGGKVTYTITVTAPAQGDSPATTTPFTLIIDKTKPVVVESLPADGATDVDFNTSQLTVRFDRPVEQVSGGQINNNVVNTLFTLTQGTTPLVAGRDYTATWADNTITIKPVNPLVSKGKYTIEIKGELVKAKDVVYGQPNVAKTISFTVAEDKTPPTATFSPQDNSVDVPTSVTPTLTFSKDVTYATGAAIPPSNVTGLVDLVSGGTSVPYRATYNSATRVLTVTPNSPLSLGVQYTLILKDKVVKDKAGNLNGQGSSSFTTIDDTLQPKVNSAVPANNATNVDRADSIVIKFNKNVYVAATKQLLSASNASSVVSLKTEAGAAVPYQATYDSATYTLTLKPAALLQPSTTYKLAIDDKALADLKPNYLPAYSLTFKTQAADTTPPVATLTPAHGSTGVPIASSLSIRYSKKVYLGSNPGLVELSTANAATANLFNLTDNRGVRVATTVSYNPNTYVLTITPQTNLNYATSYTLTAYANSVKDSSGNKNATATAAFTTVADTNPPTAAFTPASGSSNIPLNSSIVIQFSKPVTLLSSSYVNYILLKDSQTNATIPFTASWASGTQQLTIRPTSELQPASVYTVTVLPGLVRDNSNLVNQQAFMYFITAGDYVAPTFTAVPANWATNVSIAEKVYVTVSKPIRRANGDEITNANADQIVRLVDQNGNVVQSSVTWSASLKKFTIAPVYLLRPETDYSILINGGAVKDSAGNTNISFTSNFRTVMDAGPPMISANLNNGQTNVSLTEPIVLSFTKNVLLASGAALTNSNVGQIIALKDDKNSQVAFTATWDSRNLAATVSPKTKLLPGKRYTLSVDAGKVKDANGNKNNSFTLTFTTIAANEQVTVISKPLNGEDKIPLDTDVNLKFSKPVKLANGQSLTNANVGSLVSLKNSKGTAVKYRAEWSEDERILSLHPSSNLARNESYTIYLPAGVLIDAYNNEVPAYVASFSTERDASLPVIQSVPANGDEEVAVTEPIRIVFDQDVTLSGGKQILNSTLGKYVKLYDENFKAVSAKYSWDAKKRVITITPRAMLKIASSYTVRIEPKVFYSKDKKGNAGFVATFDTVTQAPPMKITTSPKDGATKVLIRASLKATFDMDVTLANGTAITNTNVVEVIKLLDSAGKPVPYTAKWSKTTKTITLEPKLRLLKKSKYVMVIPAGSFSNISGIVNDELRVSFETEE